MAKTVLRGRISYPHLFEPYGMDGQEPKYSVCLLIDKDDAVNVKKAKEAIAETINEGMASKWGGKKPVNLKNPLRDGDAEKPDSPEYQNCYFINCNSSRRKPEVVLRYKDPATGKPMDGDEDSVYAGCYCNISVSFYPFAVSGNNGVAAGLGNVQKWEDGERLGAAVKSAADEFEFDDMEEADLDDLL